MKPPLDLLVPRPHSVKLTGGAGSLPARPAILSPGPSAAAVRLVGELKRLGFDPREVTDGQPADVRLALDDSLQPEGYRLDVGAAGIDLTAGSPAGLYYGAATLAQWLELHRPEDGGPPSRLAGVAVRDRPDFGVRGVMLDISRCKVPRLATLFELIDLLAGLKVNQLQLYMEHTFAYRGHEAVWESSSPLTAEEVRRLDAYCTERFIELVPNQNSFGHFHRWLVHDRYRPLAECPEGFVHPFSDAATPFSLCPLDPGSLELLADLFDQLLPNFESRLFNVGCDETMDLGHGRSRDAVAERGSERVYLDFLQQVHGLVEARGHRMQFWGDIIIRRPELIPELPGDAIALEWGYEADHPFAEDCRRFAESGREFYVCPGTSSWNSFAGRTDNAIANLGATAVHGHAAGAAGYLNTDWGDNGHLQPLPVSYPGLVAGAAFAWNVETARAPFELPVAALLDRHVLRDRAGIAGRVLTDLGNAYRHAPTPNGSSLFFLTVFALLDKEHDRIRGVTSEALSAALEHVRKAAAPLAGAHLGDVGRELAWTADVLAFSCRLGLDRLASGDMSTFAGISAQRRRELAHDLRSLIERHREIFLTRHRPGGLEESAGRLGRVADLLDSHAEV